MSIIFEWDSAKAKANLAKHGVSFEEALTVFDDPQARIHVDPDHSQDEFREIAVGHSAGNRLLLVSFTERTETIRIINAREPDKHERRDYEEKSLQ